MSEDRFKEAFRRITSETPDAPLFADLETHRATPPVPVRFKLWMAVAGAAALVIVVIGVVGLVRSNGGGNNLARPAISSTTTTTFFIPADCPATIPTRDFTPPDTHPAEPADPDGAWYGTDQLWTVLPLNGDYGPRKSVWWSANFPGGVEEGQPEIMVRYTLLNSQRDIVLTNDRGTNAYTSTQGWFMIADIDPNIRGCWEVTAVYKGASLTYIYYNQEGRDPSSIVVPDVVGMTVDRARNVLHDAMYEASFFDSADPSYEVCAQEPGAGLEINPGEIIGMRTAAAGGCDELMDSAPPDNECRSLAAPQDFSVMFSCGDSETPSPRPVPRLSLPGTNPIETAFRYLLAGPTDDEISTGYYSWFSDETADALISATLDGDHLVLDFTEAVLVNNASTSTGSIFFLAELNANAFAFDDVQSVDYLINGRCDGIWAFVQAGPECRTVTRADWEATQAKWENS